MTTEIVVPSLPESVADATVAKWYVNPGDPVQEEQALVDLETDKVMLEVTATQSGTMGAIAIEEGTVVTAGQVLGAIEAQTVSSSPENTQSTAEPIKAQSEDSSDSENQGAVAISPSVRRLISEHQLDASTLQATGAKGQMTKEDVLAAAAQANMSQRDSGESVAAGHGLDRRVPMSRLRARVAERLVQAQQSAAMLTTFNEVNMQPIMDLRATHRDAFEAKHGVRLGFMSFFVRACVAALKQFPDVNASVDGQEIVYHDYFDIGIAVSSPRGLVVPIIRSADQLSNAMIESQIVEFAGKAKAAKLTVEEMSGGTFSITNGGIFGSMLSTPILNLPQSAILGMHNIVKRAVVENDQIVIRPMMYLALTYDHRIIDGAQSVRFLVKVKEILEDPARLLLDL